MGKYKFYCLACFKQNFNFDLHTELKGKKLCRDCASKGWGLKEEVIAYMVRTS